MACAALALAAVALFASPATAGPLIYYAMDETTPGPVVDSVSGLNGTNHNATIGVPGGALGSTAYEFNGSSSYIDLGNLPQLHFGYGDAFSATAWVRRDGTGTRAIVGDVRNGSPYDGWLMAQRNVGGTTRLDFSLGASGSQRLLVDSAGPLPAGTLTQLAITYDGSGSAAGVKMYMNGAPVSTAAAVNNATGTWTYSYPASIGEYSGGTGTRWFDGLIDDVAIYAGYLSSDAVKDIYTNGVAAFNASTGGIIARYDGTYDPAVANPPFPDTHWGKTITDPANDSIVPNSPGDGLAAFNDPSTGGRVSIFDTLDPGVHKIGWAYETRLQFDSLTGAGLNQSVLLGVRDEGGDGRIVLLGFDPISGPNYGSLYFADNGGGIVQTISDSNYIDGQMHTYRVEKLYAGGGFGVQVYVDGVAQFATPLDYSSFPLDVNGSQGFGFFSSTPGTSSVTFDYVQLAQVPVPEPSTLALLGLGAVGLLVFGGRRRKK